MATPPTFVDEIESVWNTNSPTTKNISVTVQSGDLLVVFGAISNSGTNNTLAVSGGGLTYTLQQSIAVSSSWGGLYCWTAPATSSTTFNVTLTQGGGSGLFGGSVYVFRNHGGVGASAKQNVSGTVPNLNLLTTGDDSAVCVFINDWNSVDGAARVWRTGAGALTERTYNRNGTTMTVYGGYHADAGVIGTYAVGTTAPAAQKPSVIAIEVLGTAGSSNYDGDASLAAVATSTAGVSLQAKGAAQRAVTAVPTASAVRGYTGIATRAVSAATTASAVVGAGQTAAALRSVAAATTAAAVRATTGLAARAVSVITSAAAQVSTNHNAVATLDLNAGLIADLGVTEPVFIFEPPTLKDQASDDPFWGRYQTQYALSVVWDGTKFVDVSVPMTDDLALLEDGTTYFLGGHIYTVTDEVATALQASGYTVEENPHE